MASVSPKQLRNMHDVGTRRDGRVRICHVSMSLCTGGLERLLADFARFHDRTRYQLEYVAMNDAGRFAREIEACRCNVHCLSAGRRLPRVRELARRLREREIDVLHTHNTSPHVDGTCAARLAGVPIVVSTRHGQRIGHGWQSRVQYRLASHWVDRIVAVSDDAARLTIETDGVAGCKVTRIWNGIDVEKFAYRGPAASPTAVSVARLSGAKDFNTLLKATRMVVRREPEFKLRVVGDGPQRTELEALCNELELRGRVEFFGERTDVAELLADAGFFVTASLSEGISLTVLEAMAVGLPVVATAVGGTPEVVEEGVTGCMVAPQDEDAMAEAILDMLSRRSEWSQMGRFARDRVTKDFDVRRMVADYEGLYERLLSTKTAGRQSARANAT